MKRALLVGLVLWMGLLLYFWQDPPAFWLSLTLTPILGVPLLIAIRQRHLVLIIFMGMSFVAHAVAPPFFFLKREFYSYAGFGAVRHFSFALGEFADIYSYLIISLYVVFAVTLLADRLLSTSSDPERPPVHRRTSAAVPRKSGRRSRLPYGVLLVALVGLIAVPLNVFMYTNRIGITGVIAEPLPYRLVGILYYSRYFLIPAGLFILYSRTRRTWLHALVIVVYALVAGLASASRFQLLLSASPVLLFGVLDRTPIRLLATALVMLAAFAFVSATRDFVYIDSGMSLVDLVTATAAMRGHAGFAPMDVIGGIANRLWGPQDVVLAYQYSIPDQLVAIRTFFMGGAPIPDLNYELFSMSLEGTGFGVGIGLLAWIVLLADEHLLLLLLLSVTVGLMLGAANVLVRRYARAGWPLEGASIPLAFFMVYSLYSSAVAWFYKIGLVAVAVLAALELLRIGRGGSLGSIAGRNSSPGVLDTSHSPGAP